MFRLAPAEELWTSHQRLIIAPGSEGVARYLDFGNSSIFGLEFFGWSIGALHNPWVF